MKVYFIAGLAADWRVFKNIRLPGEFEAEHLDWISPLQEEPLAQYSLRLAKGINTHEPFGLIGLSMGGMIAVEIAKHFSPVLTILISSVPVAAHLPGYFKVAARFGLDKLVPIQLVKSASIAKRLFTGETADDKSMLRQIIRDSDPQFIRWAMHAVLHWKNETPPSNYVHIHGTLDEVLPVRFTSPTHTLARAGHLLVLNRATDINRIIGVELQKATKSSV